VEDPKSDTAANTMHLYARFLDQQGRTSEAEVMEKQAADITRAYATNYARQMGNPGVTFRSATVLGYKAYVQARSNEPSDATPPPQMPTPSEGAFRVGGGVRAPVLLSKVEPEYTEEARAAKYQGTVLVYIEVGPDGQAHNMKVIRSLGMGLDEKAIESVNRWKFRPGTKDGQPVTVQATIEVNFRLQ
jgi:TonB family protein